MVQGRGWSVRDRPAGKDVGLKPVWRGSVLVSTGCRLSISPRGWGPVPSAAAKAHGRCTGGVEQARTGYS